MKFRDFMLLEGGGFGGMGKGGGDFFGNYLYPSDAFDWSDSINEPQDIAFIEKRWKRDHNSGRKFYNIDLDGVLKTKYVSIQSETMPDGKPGRWKHKSDSRPNLKVAKGQMKFLGVGKSADMQKQLSRKYDHIDKSAEFDKLFGTFKPKYPSLADDFDKPWKNKRK